MQVICMSFSPVCLVASLAVKERIKAASVCWGVGVLEGKAGWREGGSGLWLRFVGQGWREGILTAGGEWGCG